MIQLAETYVPHGDAWFRVSTANRRSSALAAYDSIYAETLVWEWFRESGEIGRLIGQDDCAKDSIKAHQRMVERLFTTGNCEEVQ